jgi:DNA replication protein DnaC
MSTATTCVVCGAPAEHLDALDLGDGAFAAALLSSLPPYCGACADRQARECEAASERDGRIRQQEEIRRRILMLPSALRDHTLDTVDQGGREPILTVAREFAAGSRSGLAFTGPVGVGKTVLAAATVRSYIEGGGPRAVRWLSVPRAVAVLGRDFGNEERADVLAGLTDRSSLLVLDDIDKSKPSPHVAELIFSAIDTCIAHRRPLLLTTNLMPSQLAARYPAPHGEAIASRIVGYCAVYKLAGHDRRIPLRAVA